MSTIRLALVGCGDHGRGGHLEAYRQLIAAGEDCAVVAVCDRDPARARLALERAPGARVYTDLAELLDRERLDGLSVATPPRFHRAQVLAALAKGVPVLCEKPLAMNLAEAEDMIAAAERSRCLLTMGLQLRYRPATRYLRDLFARGELGPVYHTRLWCGHIWRLPPSPHFLNAEMAGGGVVAATAVHLLDATLWMLGNPPIATVSASTYAKAPRLTSPPPPFENDLRLPPDDVEDFAVALIRFADGSTLSLETTWLYHPTTRPNGVQFLAERGVAEHSPLAVRWDGDGTIVDRTPANVPSTSEEHYFLEVARDFIRAIRSGEPTAIRPTEMLQVQATMDAIYASARSGREVAVG